MSDLERLIAEIARREAGGLLAEALRQARREATDELAGLLRPALRDAALRSGQSTEPGTEPAEPEPTTVPAATGLYAYGFTPERELDLRAVTGVDPDDPPRVYPHAGLGLIVSRIQLSELDGLDSETPTEDGRLATLVRRHDTVVRAAFEQAPVVPLRFGTVLPDRTAATALLADRHDEVSRLLDRIAGSQEWGLKVTAAHEPEPPEEPRPASGTEYLTRRRAVLADADATQARRQEALDAAHASLSARAVDSVHRGQHAAGAVLLDAAYLVPRSQTNGFLTDAKKLAGALDNHGLDARLTGPWPPYSFASAELQDTVDA